MRWRNYYPVLCLIKLHLMENIFFLKKQVYWHLISYLRQFISQQGGKRKEKICLVRFDSIGLRKSAAV